MWSDWLVFCGYGFSVFTLWCPFTTPTILLGFLFPWTWGYLVMAAPAKRSHCSLPWTRGISSWTPLLTLNMEELLLRSSDSLDMGLLLPTAAPDLGRGVAPLGHASVQSVTASTLRRSFWIYLETNKTEASGSSLICICLVQGFSGCLVICICNLNSVFLKMILLQWYKV